MKSRAAILVSVVSLFTAPLVGLSLQAQQATTRLDNLSERPADPPKIGIVSEVEKMVQAGAAPDVIKAFIQNWTSQFTMTADEILHLHDIGVSTDVLTTLIQRSAQLEAQALPVPVPNPSGPGPATYPEMAATNPPAYMYPYPSSYPSYAYSYLYPGATYPLVPDCSGGFGRGHR